MQFEWDPAKDQANFNKHGVTFDEATTVFFDELSLTGDDPDHSDEEDRFITFGISAIGRLLVVVHTDRDERLRVISARPATLVERRLYEEG